MTTVRAEDGITSKAAGLARVEQTAPTFLFLVRLEAKRLSAKNGSVTADDVREYADSVGLRPPTKHAWGAVFSERGWRQTGWVRSRRPANHSHRNPVWTWEGQWPVSSP